jgi:signal transduction histidine kinase
VIQRLFGAGLALQAVSATADREVAAGIESQIDVIDSTIRDIRTVIFALGSGERRGVKRLRDRMLDVVADVTDSWAVPPRISFSGPLDSLVSPGLTEDIVAVLRELLTNVGKYAHARDVEIAVAATGDNVELIVRDDGVGIPDSVPRSGLANIADRARLRGGDCDVLTPTDGGTRVRWSAPIDHENRTEE